MPKRSFSSPTGGEPIEFDLNGVTFHPIPELPAGFNIDVYLGSKAEGLRLFETVLPDDEFARWNEMIHDKRPGHVVTQPVYDDIVGYLMECYTGRPTGPVGDSANGQSPIEASSTPVP